jgi:hypothetical protein
MRDSLKFGILVALLQTITIVVTVYLYNCF